MLFSLGTMLTYPQVNITGLVVTSNDVERGEVTNMVQVSEFAPPKYQKSLSYVVGWCCCLGWISGIPSCGLQLAGVVQEMVILVYPNANVQTLWQTTLMVFLFVVLTVGFNIFFARHLPLAEGVVLFIHVFAFFAFLLTLWIMPTEHATAREVFTTFK